MRKHADIITELQPHQQRVVDRLQEGNVLAAHGMGSGKTLASIAAADALGIPTTVLTPASLVDNYKKEIAKHSKNLKAPITVMSLPTAANRGYQVPQGGFLVIDEAHSLRNPGSARYDYVKGQVDRSKRVALLTGTPSYNKIDNTATLINLISNGENPLSSGGNFSTEFVKTRKVSPGIIAKIMGADDGEVSEFKNKDKLQKVLRQYMDVHRQKLDSPTRTDEHVDVDMPADQEHTYRYVESKDVPLHIQYKVRWGLPLSKKELSNMNAFLTGVRQASNSVYPYKEGMSYLEAGQGSPKLMRAVDEVKNRYVKDPNFRGLVYSNYLDAGIRPMSALLTDASIPHAVFHGGMSQKQKSQVLNDYNTGKIAVILGSSSAAEGLDLKGTKLVQVLEPHFNESKVDQVIGRAIRYKSHDHLPENERNVTVQRFHSRLPRTFWNKIGLGARPASVDEWMRNYANEKKEQSEELFRLAGEK